MLALYYSVLCINHSCPYNIYIYIYIHKISNLQFFFLYTTIYCNIQNTIYQMLPDETASRALFIDRCLSLYVQLLSWLLTDWSMIIISHKFQSHLTNERMLIFKWHSCLSFGFDLSAKMSQSSINHERLFTIGPAVLVLSATSINSSIKILLKEKKSASCPSPPFFLSPWFCISLYIV